MEILDKYIGKAVFTGVFAVMFVIVMLFALISFAGEMNDVGKANYGIQQALIYVLLNIPQNIYYMSPMIVLLGTILSLGMLASSSELIAMRAAGVSIIQITVSVLKSGTIIVALIVIIGEFIAPPAVQYAKLKQLSAMNEKISLNTDFGLWARDGNNYIHIQNVDKKTGRLNNINIYIYDDKHRLIQTLNAKNAFYLEDRWQLNDVTRRLVSLDSIQTEKIPQLKWQSLLNPEVIDVVSVDSHNLSIIKLRSYIEYLKSTKQETKEYELSFWTKLIAPLTIAGMIILAIPFVFGSLRNVGAGQRIIFGFLLGLGFYIFSRLVANAGLVYTEQAWIAAIFPTLVILMIGIFLLRRVR